MVTCSMIVDFIIQWYTHLIKRFIQHTHTPESAILHIGYGISVYYNNIIVKSNENPQPLLLYIYTITILAAPLLM